ncbi:MAG: phosphodiester glycosidase family protein [Peptococcaceae bacterium]|nr:phosphodiester glycosidase family protein [Peptococcaceae bacterium]
MHLRRNIVLAVLLLVMFCFSCPAFAAGNTLQVHVDGKAASMEAKVSGSLAFLPARDMANVFDASLAYDAKKKELTLKSGKTTAILTVGSSNISVNGKKVSLDASPMIVDSTTYIPVKAVSAIWGASYGSNEQALYIRTDGKAVQVPEVEKVFTKRQAVSIGGKNTPVNYVLVPKSSNLRADVALAQNSVGQTETMKSLAQRTSAKAAVNGSYFQSYDSSKSQDPYGILIKNGNLIHSESTGSTVAFTRNGSVKMDIVRSAVTATVGGTVYNVSLVNHTPAASSNTVVLYNSAYGKNTNCAGGTALIVQNGEVVSVHSNKAVDIPSNGYVLLFTGNKAAAANGCAKGTKVSYTTGFVGANGTKLDWSDVRTAVGAGPLLLKDGAVIVNPAKEGFSDSAGFDLAVARSAVGVMKNGDILLVAGVKCTLNQMASVMSQLGAVHAISMDSGSASGLYVPGCTLPTPGKEISNILIFK